MADNERPGEAADGAGAEPADAPTTVGPNLPLQVRRNAHDAGAGSPPSGEDDEGDR